jgi:class I fructose-bisphosphate aldolase
MRITQRVKKILDWYEGDPPGVKANLARIIYLGKV